MTYESTGSVSLTSDQSGRYVSIKLGRSAVASVAVTRASGVESKPLQFGANNFGPLAEGDQFALTVYAGQAEIETDIPSPSTQARTSLRNVATRCQIPNIRNASFNQTMTRSAHYARDSITALKLVYGSWLALFNLGEVGYGVPTTYSASIEYPASTFTQVLFSGATTGTAPDLGEVISDYCAVTIPKGERFWVRTWTSNSGGINYITTAAATGFGEAFEFGITTTNKTMSGTLTDTGSGMYVPMGILAVSDVPSVWLAGDSRVVGQADTFTGAKYNDVGELARSIGPQLPYINAGCPTEPPHLALTGSTRRVSLAKRFCTHVVCNYGINGINAYTRTGAQVLTDLTSYWALFDPLPVFQTTLAPVSTSTDSFATTVNQTTAATNAERVILNNSLRLSVGTAGIIELADAVESARDSGLWKAPAYTADGLHGLQKAYAAQAAAGTLRGIFV